MTAFSLCLHLSMNPFPGSFGQCSYKYRCAASSSVVYIEILLSTYPNGTTRSNGRSNFSFLVKLGCVTIPEETQTNVYLHQTLKLNRQPKQWRYSSPPWWTKWFILVIYRGVGEKLLPGAGMIQKQPNHEELIGQTNLGADSWKLEPWSSLQDSIGRVSVSILQDGPFLL